MGDELLADMLQKMEVCSIHEIIIIIWPLVM